MLCWSHSEPLDSTTICTAPYRSTTWRWASDGQSGAVAPLSFVSYLDSGDPELRGPGYILEREFGGVRVTQAAVR